MPMARVVAMLGVCLLVVAGGATTHVRSSHESVFQRSLQTAKPYYHILSSNQLGGGPNPDAAVGNPLKGLVESPIYTNPPYQADMPLAVEFYYIGLDEVMKGNPDLVSAEAAFDWTVLDNALSGSASRHMHAAWRVIVDFPGQPLKVPRHLLDAGIDIRLYNDGASASPYYGDAQLLRALEQFIAAMGKRYDGDTRLGFVQAGLLGFWGEWHTWGGEFIPDDARTKVLNWYIAAFTKTQVMMRYGMPDAYKAGFGRHDDSFAFSTLDGPDNGGQVRDYYTWPDIVKNGQSDFWKRGVMGGETRGDLAWSIFEPGYKVGFERQSFMRCVEVTHASWMFHHAAFKDGGFTGDELRNARSAHARMGYNFYVPTVAVKTSTRTTAVDVDVTVQQIGVAPFYYDLSLGLACAGMNKRNISGVADALIDKNSTKVYSFTGVPATSACLNALTISLESSYAYIGRPIKFAQGTGKLVVSLPMPPNMAPTPVAKPVAQPPVVKPVAPTPVVKPVTQPIALQPIASPVPRPAPTPTESTVGQNSFDEFFLKIREFLEALVRFFTP